MSHLAEDIDLVPHETRPESARGEPGFEVLDGVATKIAIDQEQRITSLVIAPTVAVPTSATVDPDADPLMVELGAMTTAELKTYIKDEIALGERVLADEKLAADEHKRIKGQRLQVTYEVVCALRELKSRLKASKTWEKALAELHIIPSTWRSWDCRELNLLTTGKRTKSRKVEPDGRSLAQTQADLAKAKAAVDAERAASLAQPDPVEVEAEYIDEPVDIEPETEEVFIPKPRTIKQIERALKEADADAEAITWLEQVIKAVATETGDGGGPTKDAIKARRAQLLAASLWSESENIHPYPTREELERLKADESARLVPPILDDQPMSRDEESAATVTAWHSRVIKGREEAKAKRKAKYGKPDVDADDGEQDINNLLLHDLTEKDLEDMK